MNFIPHDYSTLDKPEVLMNLFHPRHERWEKEGSESQEKELLIPVEGDQLIGAKFHLSEPGNPVILFFHGNGEIVSDYDEIALYYLKNGLSFLLAGYRGYGKSTGEPTASAMIQDSHTIFEYVKRWLEMNGYRGPIIVMGRSLGSASALEISSKYQNEVSGLVIESGFAHTINLLSTLGINTGKLGLKEEKGLRHMEKIKKFRKSLKEKIQKIQ